MQASARSPTRVKRSRRVIDAPHSASAYSRVRSDNIPPCAIAVVPSTTNTADHATYIWVNIFLLIWSCMLIRQSTLWDRSDHR